MDAKKAKPVVVKSNGNKKGVTVGSAEVAREVLGAVKTSKDSKSKLTELLNRAAQLPKPEVPSAKVEKTTPSLKQEEAAGRELVNKLTPHFAALMAAEAELADAKTTSTNGDGGNIFISVETRAKLEEMLQGKKGELEKRVEGLNMMLQPFFDEAPGLRKTLESKFEASQKAAVSEQGTQATIERVKKLAEDNFAGGVTPGRVSVFLEKASRMIGVLDRVPAEETLGLDRSNKKVICHRFSQAVTYDGFMADFRKEAVAKAKAEGMTTGYIKAEVWFKADVKDPRPGIVTIGIVRAREREIYEANKARKNSSAPSATASN
ncbi:MAG: hypothetical protein UV05_C0032G0005 [candidate division CPR1 bacterium GW2011_GWA2_42_17]|uniref:Uncharacterized protein n=1 Tax=candidate division CPR1 bacterium GW2011_GWA2_42_17 TaxID=1618341 RepID=A0A0G1BAA2_9BACT|nr:MAG: hypothetical protein UV05_C0032G0005 [candidate division CPR1 bacterium GW2011_GWA2_42_17]